MTPSTRREARERALELLYAAAVKGVPLDGELSEVITSPDPFTCEIVTGIAERQLEIDRLIERFAQGWSFERLAMVDLQVLRIGTFELMAQPATPGAVVLSEAVDLVKRYSTDDSARFVNGVLAAIARHVRNEGITTSL